MIKCEVGAIVNMEELAVLEHACTLNVKVAEVALRSKTIPRAHIASFKCGIRIYTRYVRMIQRVRRAKRRG